MRQKNRNIQNSKKPLNKKWWFWLLMIMLLPFLCLYGIYILVTKYKKTQQKRWLIGIIPLAFVSLAGFMGYADAITNPSPTQEAKTEISTEVSNDKKETLASEVSISQESVSSSTIESSSSTPQIAENEILTKLIEYTNAKSSGPTKNYYWENGAAKLSGFDNLKSGDHKFEADSKGRSAVARAVLTYSQYKSSKGSRQGEPLDPPHWPTSNPKVGITFSLTGKIYHGYKYNRSHSIADSLLGKDSYTSNYNFTTGTRSQNVGANQNGGMRFAEETVEKYWQSHQNTDKTVNYQTTPIYNENETIPRGSIVDIKSSDNILDVQIVVINSAEGLDVDYNNIAPVTASTTSSEPLVQASSEPVTSIEPTPAEPVVPEPAAPTNDYTTSGQWTIAAPGMVFVHNTSNKYYRQVTIPGNYTYMSQDQANASGAVPGQRANSSARP